MRGLVIHGPMRRHSHALGIQRNNIVFEVLDHPLQQLLIDFSSSLILRLVPVADERACRAASVSLVGSGDATREPHGYEVLDGGRDDATDGTGDGALGGLAVFGVIGKVDEPIDVPPSPP